MPPISQSQHRESLLIANRAVIARIRDSVTDVPAHALTRRPPDGGWSIAEVLEHLIVSADSYLTSLRLLVKAKNGGLADTNAIWKPTLMGGLLASSLRSPRKMPTAKSYKPGPSPRPRALDEFLQRQEDVGALIAEAGAMDWRRVRMRSPVLPIINMNLGDAFTVLVVHAERHAAQIERVKAKTLGKETQLINGAHAIIYSTHAEADRAFFADVLKLPSVDAGGGWLIFGLPPAEVAVHPSGENDKHELYLMCDDIEALVAEMKQRRLTCGPVQDEGWGLLSHVALPGGGRLGVYQPRHPRASA